MLEDRPFRLDELIQERADWITPQADAHNFTITLRNPRACPFRGDAFRMGQVFTILMENSLRYGREGGHLEVTLHYARGSTPSNSPMTVRVYQSTFTGHV